MTGVLIIRGEDKDKRHGGEHQVMREPGLKCLNYKPSNTKITGNSPGARKRQGRMLYYRFQRKHGIADTLILNF